MKNLLYTALIAVTLFTQSGFTALAAESTFTTSLTTFGADTTPPSAPTGLVATPISQSQIDLSWIASIDDTGVAGYVIYRDGSAIATTTLLSYSDTGLVASTIYSYAVRAFDVAFNYSLLSASASTSTLAAPIIVTPPASPANPSSGGQSSSPFPIIYDVRTTTDTTSALVSFSTLMPARSTVSWGVTSDLEAGSVTSILYDTAHEVQLIGLQPATHYYAHIVAQNAQGLQYAVDIEFTTASAEGSPLPNPSGFAAIALDHSIGLTWANPTDPRFTGVRIVRSDMFFPRDQFDGVQVYEASGVSFEDEAVVAGKTYYYAIFAEGRGGIFSSGALAFARIAIAGQQPDFSQNGNPFATAPQASNVDAALAHLALRDFEFIQAGKDLIITGTSTISVNGRGNLTIRLAYGKVPQILKTIAVALTDPRDPTKAFIFLLRANEDKTYYEAAINPLNKEGIYPLAISILDYQNQSLTQIRGTVDVYMDASSAPKGDLGQLAFWLIILILLALLAAFIKKSRADKKKAASAVLAILLLASACSSFSVLLSPSSASAAFNSQINYQGKLANSLNATVADGNYNMVFKLYTTPTGATTSAIWTETDNGSNAIAVKNGLFSVMLGSTTALTGIDFNQTLYLGVAIGTDNEMTPRKVLGAVPAAMVSATSTIALSANTLQNLTPGQFFRTDAQNSTSTASTFLNVLQSGAGKVAEFFGSASQSVLALLSNGNVGIGTTTPASVLAISNTVNTAANTPLLTIASTTAGTATSTLVTVLANGNVGIGTSNPLQTLDVKAGGTYGYNGSIIAQADTSLSNYFFGGAGNFSISGSSNTGTGKNALSNTTFGGKNTSNGFSSLADNTTGTQNTAVGYFAGTNSGLLQTMSNSTFIGSGANSSVDAVTNSTAIGNGAQVTQSNQMAFGNANVTQTLLRGNIRGDYFTATSSVLASTFPYASTTAVSAQTICLTGDVCRTTWPVAAASAAVGWASTTADIQSIYFVGTGKVGIGTSTPWGQLSVNPNALTGPSFVIGSSTATSLIVTNGGFVGIGNANPTQALNVTGNGLFSGTLTSQSGTSAFSAVQIGNSAGNLNVSATTLNIGNAGSNVSFLGTGQVTVAGRLGIGTTTPSAALSVSTTSQSVGTLPLFVVASTTNATLFTVLGNGNVGIAKTNPTAALDVTGSGVFSNQLTGGTVNLAGSKIRWNSHTTTYIDMSGGSNTNSVSIGTNGADQFTVAYPTGYVGIGTTTPYASLSVDGRGVFNQDVRADYFTSTSTTIASTFPYASTTALSAQTICLTGDTCRTSWPTGAASYLTSSSSAAFTYLNTGTTLQAPLFNATSTTGTSTFAGGLTAGGASGLNVLQNGNVGIGTGAASNLLTVVGTTQPQASIGYDTSNYFTLGVTSAGMTSISLNGASSALVVGASQPAAVGSGVGTSATTTLTVIGATGGNTAESGLFSNAFGGVGGGIVLTGGMGGSPTATGSTFADGGMGGTVAISGGQGGDALVTGALAGGNGGNLNLLGGSGGAVASGGFIGNGGNVNITGGSGNGAGNIYMAAGTGNNGNIYLGNTSAGTPQGNVYLGKIRSIFNTSANIFGIGTLSPVAQLQVSSTTGSSNVLVGYTSGTYGGIGFGSTLSLSNAALFGQSTSTQIGVANGGIILSRIGNDSSFGELRQATNTLTYAGGSFGVGTTTPYAALSVDGRGVFNQDVRANYFTATSTTIASIFSLASTTQLTISKLYDSTNSLGTNGFILQTNGSVATWVSTTTLGILANLASSTGTLGIANGGTGATSFGQGWLFSNGGTGALSASTSPTVAYLTATSTTATSTFAGGLSVAGAAGLTVLQNGNVGIGSTSPTAALSVNGSINMPATNGQGFIMTGGPQLTSTGGANGSLAFPGVGSIDVTGDFFFRNNPITLTYMVIKSGTGNVGIGTSSPYAKLAVDGRGIFNQDVRADYFTSTSTTIASTFPYASTTAITSSGSAYFATTAGNVGVGITNPTFKIDTNGSLGIGSTSDVTAQGEIMRLRVGSSGGSTGYMSFQRNSGSNASYGIGFFNQNGIGIRQLGDSADTFNITSSGNTNSSKAISFGNVNGVVSATTTIYSSNAGGPATMLVLSNPATPAGSNPRMGFNSLSASGSNHAELAGITAVKYSSVTSTNVTGGLAFSTTNDSLTGSTERMRIDYLGNVGIGTTTPYAALSVAGRGVFDQDVRADYFTSTSTSIASTFPYASTTALSAQTICLTGDTCRTTWPAGGGGYLTSSSSVAYTYLNTGTILQAPLFNATSTTGTSTFVGGVTFAADTGSLGMVGIGTSTPSAKLALKALGTGTGRAFVIADSSNAEKLTVLDNGNVGIASTSPGFQFAIGSNPSAGASDFSVSANGTNASMRISSQSITGLMQANPNAIGSLPAGLAIGTTGGGTTTLGYLAASSGGAVRLNFSTNGSNTGFRISHNFTDLFAIDSTGKVGIGTVTPTSQLEVKGTGAATDGISITTSAYTSIPNPGATANLISLNPRGFNFTFDSATLSTAFQPSAGIGVAVSRANPAFAIKNTGGPALVTETGNVGIGTSTPAALLDVAGTIRVENNNTPSSGAGMELQYNTGTGNANILAYDRTASAYKTFSIDATSETFTNSGTAAMTITGGKVGIGTTSPATYINTNAANNLDVTGSSGKQGLISLHSFGTSQEISMMNNVGQGGYFDIGGASTGSNNFFAFRTTNTNSSFAVSEALRITSAGSIGIGSSSPMATLSVAMSSTTSGLIIGVAGSTTPAFTVASANNNGAVGVRRYSSGGASLEITELANGQGLSLFTAAGTQQIGIQNSSLNAMNSSGATTVQMAGSATGGMLLSSGQGFSWDANATLSGGNDVGFTRGAAGKLYLGTGATGTFGSTLVSGGISIGSTTPSAKFALHDNSGLPGTNTLFAIASSTSGNTGTTTLFVVKGSGNVGIGTTSPQFPLAVVGGIDTGYGFTSAQFSSGSNESGINLFNTGTGGRSFNLFTSNNASGLGGGKFSIADATAGASRLLIDSTGNVGIGTTTPGGKLEISTGGVSTAGALRLFSGGASNFISFYMGRASRDAEWGVAGAAGQFTSTAVAGDSVFKTVNRAFFVDTNDGTGVPSFTVLANNGNIGIGQATPATKLDVNGDVTIETVTSCNNSTHALGTDSTGKIVCNASLSDERLKGDITSLNGEQSLDLINRLNPVSFYWKDPTITGTNSTQLQYGFIAQDVAKLSPNLVGTTTPTYLTPDMTYYMNYQGIIAPLVKAVQQQQSEILAASSSSSVTLASLSSQVQILSVSISSSTGTMYQAIDRQNAEIASLRSSLDAATSTLASSVASTTATTLASSNGFIQSIAAAVMDLLRSSGQLIQVAGSWTVDQIHSTLAVFNRVETKDLAVSNGLEMSDSANGDVYCVRITNGAMKSVLGSCSSSGVASPLVADSNASANEISSGGQATTTGSSLASAIATTTVTITAVNTSTSTTLVQGTSFASVSTSTNPEIGQPASDPAPAAAVTATAPAATDAAPVTTTPDPAPAAPAVAAPDQAPVAPADPATP